MITSPDDVKRLGTILCVWAHPDDETFAAAGILAAAANNGQRVVCLTATRGEAGVQNAKRWPPAQLGAIRERELLSALKTLGIKEHFFLDYLDGACHEISDGAAAKRIAGHIEACLPNSILTFGPDGLTGHPDHKAVSRWTTLAAQGSQAQLYYFVEEEKQYEQYMKELDKRFNIYFMIDKPPTRAAADCEIALKLTPKLVQKKCAALKVMPSQTEGMFGKVPPEFLHAALSQECFVRA